MGEKNWLDGIEERVVAAYRKHGLKAEALNARGPSPCALGALYRTELDAQPKEESSKVICAASGAPKTADVLDFMFGFDDGLLNGKLHESHDNEVGRAGFRTAQRVIAEGLKA